MPPFLKHLTVWLVLGTAVFVGVQYGLAREQAARMTVLPGGGGVELLRDRSGHHHWPARVQGEAVDFLVDSGATNTALPAALAERLGLPRGQAVRSRTANGETTGWRSQADLELQGGFVLKNWPVTVLPGLDEPLLGMDVIGRLHSRQQGGRWRFEAAPGSD